MIYAVRHVTRFTYEAPMRHARCNLRLQPIDWPGQAVLDHVLDVSPAAEPRPSRVGAYVGHISRIVVDVPTRTLAITARSTVQVDREAPTPAPTDPTVGAVAEQARAAFDLSVTSPANYIFPSPMIALTREIADWCGESLGAGRGVIEAAEELARRIRASFRYDGTATETITTPAQAFAAKAGVCQDFAQVMIAGLRSVGLPAAYVSGYLRTLPPPGKPRLVGVDATHAWVMLWGGPARGWIGFDPTNGVAVGCDHIITAVGRDYADVAPIDGVFVGQAGQKIEVCVDVEPIDDALLSPTIGKSFALG